MGKTYLYIQDIDPTSSAPTSDTVVSFSIYNDAMSYAKWLTIRVFGSNGVVRVWNSTGGSGYW